MTLVSPKQCGWTSNTSGYISEKIDEGEFELKWTDTKYLVADGLTKPLVGTSFKIWRDRILNLN